MSWTYHQATGELFKADGERVGLGYAGFGLGKNNPAMEQVEGLGPVPRGGYLIGPAYDHHRLGPLTMNLTPDIDNEMFGRSVFRIHGDNPTHDASHGCIVQDHNVRVLVNRSDDKRLEVV